MALDGVFAAQLELAARLVREARASEAVLKGALERAEQDYKEAVQARHEANVALQRLCDKLGEPRESVFQDLPATAAEQEEGSDVTH